MKIYDSNSILKRGGKDVLTTIETRLSRHVLKEHDNKFRCELCQKLFKGDDFVKKHIRGKHSSVVSEEEDDVEFFNMFVYDPWRIGGELVSFNARPNNDRRDTDRRDYYRGNNQRDYNYIRNDMKRNQRNDRFILIFILEEGIREILEVTMIWMRL
jgi:hypothetical protein